MTKLKFNHNYDLLAGLLTKQYPRRGILLFKLLEDIKASFSSLKADGKFCLVNSIQNLNQNRFLQQAAKQHDSACLNNKNKVKSYTVDSKEKAMLYFANKLTQKPEEIQQSDIKAVFDFGWTEQEFYETVYLCAIANCMNTFIYGIGLNKDSLLDTSGSV